MKECSCFQNVYRDGNRWFDKGFLAVTQFTADAFSLKPCILFVHNLVLLSQGFAASSSQLFVNYMFLLDHVATKISDHVFR